MRISPKPPYILPIELQVGEVGFTEQDPLEYQNRVELDSGIREKENLQHLS
jgi:hypothetical protein